MSSLGEVGALLRQALDRIDQSIAAHHHAADLAEEARDLLAVAGGGSSHGDVEQACATFTAVVDGIVDPEGQVSGLAHAAELIREYATRRGISEVVPGSASPPVPVSPALTTPKRPDLGSPEHVAALRDQLPPPVQPSKGQKTHGRWFAPGTTGGELVSGDGPESDEVARLPDVPMPRSGRPLAASHVEMKLVAHMRANRIRHAAIVINNRPCPGDFGCETLSGVLLPEGYSITVYGTGGYRQTFTGGKRAPWQR